MANLAIYYNDHFSSKVQILSTKRNGWPITLKNELEQEINDYFLINKGIMSFAESLDFNTIYDLPIRLRNKANSGKVFTKKDIEDSIKYKHSKELKKIIKQAKYLLYTKIMHVSSSGMLRVIQVIAMIKNRPWYISRSVQKVTTYYPWDDKKEGLRVGGCGMDMGFSVIYNLSSELYKDGYKIKQTWL